MAVEIKSKESGKVYTAQWFEDETFENMTGGCDYFEMEQEDGYFTGRWIAETDEDAEMCVDFGQAAAEAEEAADELATLLNGEKPSKDFPDYVSLGTLAPYFVNDVFACDVDEMNRVRDDIRELIDELTKEANEGEIVAHIESGKGFDRYDADLIKGAEGHYFLKGEGEARTVFGHLVEWNNNLYVGGEGVRMVNPGEYL